MDINMLRSILLLTAFLLFAGMFTLPIGYYTLLRIAVSVSMIVCIMKQDTIGGRLGLVACFFLLILFNPVFPVYLRSKPIWRVIDFISGVYLVYVALKVKRR